MTDQDQQNPQNLDQNQLNQTDAGGQKKLQISEVDAKYWEAKRLYMAFVPNSEIRRRLNIHGAKFSDWITGKRSIDPNPWAIERNRMVGQHVKECAEKHQMAITEVFGIGIDMVKSSLQERARSGDPLSLREAEQVTSIITALDKLARLEAGKPTEVIHDNAAPMTIKQLRDAVLKDKFAEVIDVESKPIE